MVLFLTVSVFIFFVAIKSLVHDVLSRGILYVFVGWWHLSMIGALLSKDILYTPTDLSVFILWLGVLSFCLGYIVQKIPRYLWSNYSCIYLEKKLNKILDNKLFWLILIAFAIYVIWCYTQFFAEIQLHGVVGDMRQSYFDSDNDFYGPRFHILQTFLFKPAVYVLAALFCYSLLRKRNIACLLLLVALFFYHSLGGGRFGYVLMIINLLVVYLLFYSKDNKIVVKFKTYIILAVGILVLALLLTIVTSMRHGSFDGFNKTTIEDTWDDNSEQIRLFNSGPVVAFDQALKNDWFINKAGGHTYGGLLFGPLIFLYRNVSVSFLGMPDFEQPYIRVSQNVQQDTFIKIGPSQEWNALYTWNIDFYADFGIIGIIFMNFIIGFWFRSIIKMFYKKPTASAFLLMCILESLVLFSVFNTTFNDFILWVLIIGLYIIHRQTKINIYTTSTI